MNPNKYRAVRITIGLAALIGLTGCSSFSADGGMARVQALTKERTGQTVTRIQTEADAQTVEGEVNRILQTPLTVEESVRVALLNNRNLQASYAELGIAEADLVQAGRLRNPVFSFARLTRGEEIEYERRFMMPILSLLTMPITTRIESRRFEVTQLRAASDAVRIADETRRAYYNALAAQETVAYMARANKAAAAGAELARRMASVGNWSRLQQAREQSFYADTATQLARSQLAVTGAREQLVRLMGLTGNQIKFQLPERLPDLPGSPRELSDAESMAMQNRLDIQMAERELGGLSSSLDLSRTTRFVNLLDVGYLHNNETGEPRKTGYEIEFEIPIFDWGTSKVSRAESSYMQAVHRASAIAVNARSEVRTAYANYRTAYDLARHYRDEVVPLRKRISDETQLRYNGMLVGVFELLADARSQYMAVIGAIEANRDYWMADSALNMALTGGSAEATAMWSPRTATASQAEGH